MVDPADVVLGLGGVTDHLLAQLGQDLGVADNVRLGPVERGGVLVDVPVGKNPSRFSLEFNILTMFFAQFVRIMGTLFWD